MCMGAGTWLPLAVSRDKSFQGEGRTPGCRHGHKSLSQEGRLQGVWAGRGSQVGHLETGRAEQDTLTELPVELHSLRPSKVVESHTGGELHSSSLNHQRPCFDLLSANCMPNTVPTS